MRDEGFLKYLPLSASWRMGRLQKTGISQKTCQITLIFNAFGKKSENQKLIPNFNLPLLLNDRHTG
jgi:hypothetical protein